MAYTAMAALSPPSVILAACEYKLNILRHKTTARKRESNGLAHARWPLTCQAPKMLTVHGGATVQCDPTLRLFGDVSSPHR